MVVLVVGVEGENRDSLALVNILGVSHFPNLPWLDNSIHDIKILSDVTYTFFIGLNQIVWVIKQVMGRFETN